MARRKRGHESYNIHVYKAYIKPICQYRRRYSHTIASNTAPIASVARSAVIARLRRSGVARTKRKSRGRTRQRQLRCYDGARPPFNSSMSDSVSRFTEVRRSRGAGRRMVDDPVSGGRFSRLPEPAAVRATASRLSGLDPTPAVCCGLCHAR